MEILEIKTWADFLTLLETRAIETVLWWSTKAGKYAETTVERLSAVLRAQKDAGRESYGALNILVFVEA